MTEFQYRLARPMIAERMELLVWLDLPYWRTNFPRVVARTVRRRILREEMWNGNLEGPLWRVLTDREHIVRWSVAHRNSQRGSLPGLAASKGWTVVRLRSQAEVERWLRGPLTAAADR
ncbi:hypothetical protein [Tessaracoccus coleopterorum]|uniref:hypothetical protein n=1 Tax=Tessaracoccus coleopterorum TaxID=2714950 RepID=UPI0018D4C40C|nr:hypothetical protein [Tessaracoccus coleopterorum]